MAEYMKGETRVGRKPIADDTIVCVGFRLAEQELIEINRIVAKLNEKGFSTNKSEVIRMATKIGLAFVPEAFKAKRKLQGATAK